MTAVATRVMWLRSLLGILSSTVIGQRNAHNVHSRERGRDSSRNSGERSQLAVPPREWRSFISITSLKCLRKDSSRRRWATESELDRWK